MKTIKRVHVNQHNIRANTKAGNKDLPVFTIKNKGKTTVAYEVYFDGPCTLIYEPDKPLSCGAKAWICTKDPLRYIGEQSVIGEIK